MMYGETAADHDVHDHHVAVQLVILNSLQNPMSTMIICGSSSKKPNTCNDSNHFKFDMIRSCQ